MKRLWLLFLLLGAAARADEVTVPVDVGIGPAAYYFFGVLNEGRWPTPHFGLKLDVQAVIDQEWMAAHPQAIPARYRRRAERLSEVRISPSVFIPDSVLLSPKVSALGDTGIYGITWRPLSLGLPLIGRRPALGAGRSRLRADLDAGLLLTYAFIHSDSLGTTHFLRPGIDLRLNLELELSSAVLISLGWASGFYLPQRVGGWELGPLDHSIFHVGQLFAQLHFRFPRRVNL